MNQLGASWRVALRSGRRDLRRSKGRSALISVMIGLPVMLTVLASVLITTDDLTLAERLPDELGSAQASATYIGGEVAQDPEAFNMSATDSQEQAPTVAQQEKLLSGAAGGPVELVESAWGVTVVIGDRGISSSLLAADASKPGSGGLIKLEDGRLPASTDEVMVTPGLRSDGATIGSQITVGAREPQTVVGVGQIGVVKRQPGRNAVLGMPGAFEGTAQDARFLISRSEPMTWAEVKKLNQVGFLVLSEDVINNPPSADELYPADVIGSTTESSAERAVLAVVITAIMIQIVLLAGPAFAVGVRRQRRELALLAATGATPQQVRRTVLGQAIVVGLMSCLAGAALGLVGAALIVRFAADVFDSAAFAAVDIVWPTVIAPIVLGVLAAAMAAYVPARQASKQQVAAVLAGRRGVVRSSPGWPVFGAVLVAVGLAGCFTLGRRAGGEIMVATSTIAMVLGAVLLTPFLIGAVARIGSGLPLSMRLALRDTARQRARSAPAIAAIMAAVAGVTAFAIASSSDFEQSRRAYVYETQPGRLVISAWEAGTLDSVLAAARGADSSIEYTSLAMAGRESDGNDGIYVGAVPHTEGLVDGSTAVADAQTAAAWGVSLTPELIKALDDGVVVVASSGLVKDGKVTFQIDGDGQSREVELPAVVADLGTGAVPQGPEPVIGGALLTPQTAAAHDIVATESRAISTGSVTVSEAAERRISEAVLAAAPSSADVRVERGFQETYTVAFMVLLGFGVVAVLIGTMTATGLALNDARPDFSTLAAIGAAPRTRRHVAGAQAIVLGLLGTVLGVLIGFGPGIAAAWPLTSENYQPSALSGHVLDIPWLLLAVLLVVVPAIAAATAMIFTRSRLPIVRRLAQ